jgi:hypothetical protein
MMRNIMRSRWSGWIKIAIAIYCTQALLGIISGTIIGIKIGLEMVGG